MKIFCFVTTFSENLEFLKKCVFRINIAISNVVNEDVSFKIVICDFGRGEIIKDWVDKNCNGIFTYLRNPDGSMPTNVNIGFEMCRSLNCDLFFYLNDDAFIDWRFFQNALDFIFDHDRRVGFVGGTSQVGGWNESLENIEIPKPVDRTWLITDIRRLHWEFCAFGMPVNIIGKVGNMDILFNRLGLCSDNDYLLRIRNLGFNTYRYGGMTFWHSKAVTQSRYRDPFDPKDPWRKRAVEYFKLKWGVDIDKNVTERDCFDKPFNGAKFRLINDDKFELDEMIIDLKKEFGV